jgi:hypothetical protein
MGNPVSKFQIKIQNKFKQINFSSSKMSNMLFKTFAKNNGHANISSFIQGPVWSVLTKEALISSLHIKLSKISKSFLKVCLKINGQIYTAKEMHLNLIENNANAANKKFVLVLRKQIERPVKMFTPVLQRIFMM